MDAPRVSFKPEPRRFLGINTDFSRVAWEWFVPFLQFPPVARRVLYTTHSFESLNAELRKATRNRHQFPNDIVALKTLWLIICTIEDKRALPNARRKPNAILSTTAILKEPQSTAENKPSTN